MNYGFSEISVMRDMFHMESFVNLVTMAPKFCSPVAVDPERLTVPMQYD